MHDNETTKEYSPRRLVTLDDIEARFIEEECKTHHNWLRLIVSLAGTALTLLVGLQKTYVQADSREKWLLQLCWISLAICVLSGLLVLYGEGRSSLEAVNDIRRRRRQHGDFETAKYISAQRSFARPSRFRFYELLMISGFAAAIASLALFSCWNID